MPHSALAELPSHVLLSLQPSPSDGTSPLAARPAPSSSDSTPPTVAKKPDRPKPKPKPRVKKANTSDRLETLIAEKVEGSKSPEVEQQPLTEGKKEEDRKSTEVQHGQYLLISRVKYWLCSSISSADSKTDGSKTDGSKDGEDSTLDTLV